MPASVPTQAEFDALNARVTKLEQGSQPSGESPQGTTITDATGTIILQDKTKVKLTAAGGQVSFDPGGVDTTTSNVITGLMWDHKFYQENNQHNWWYGTKGSWTGPVPDPRVPVTNPNYRVSNGQILDASGKPFKALGINIWGDIIPTASQYLLQNFPGCNYVRLNFCDQYGMMDNWTPAKLKPYLDAWTAKGIVCVIDPHDYPKIYQGDQLTKVCNWTRAQVQANGANKNVWYETQNEPGTGSGGGGAALCAMLKAIHDTVFAASADAMLLIGGEGMYTIDAWTGIDKNTWRNWRRVLWALHYYNWGSSYAGGGAPSYSADLNTNKKAVANLAAALQAAPSADGVMPVIIDEYGPSTTGDSNDAGAWQTLDAVHQSGFGTAAWNYQKLDTYNCPINPQPTTLTQYGQVLATHIRTGN